MVRALRVLDILVIVILVPTAAAFVYIFWPLIVAVIIMAICDSIIFSKQSRYFRRLEKTQEIILPKAEVHYLNFRTSFFLPATKTVFTTFLKYFCVVGFAKIAYLDSGHKYGEKLLGQQLC
jgi:Na+-translocating ferredoxin:NAD+ oxidoreductase RnfD subunit